MAFSGEKIRKVWEKAQYVNSECENNGFRKDYCGKFIRYVDYGDRDSKYGWEIDHIKPVSKGGGDDLSNLRPLHWETNLSKSDKRLKCQ